MKRKDSDIEFYRETIAILQQEKASATAERDALRVEIREMSESHRAEMAGMRQTLESLRMTLLEQTETIKELTSQLSNARAQESLNRGKRFAPTTEQRNLLNNRRTDTRAGEKDDFDGNPPSTPGAASAAGNQPANPETTRKKKKCAGRKPAKEH